MQNRRPSVGLLRSLLSLAGALAWLMPVATWGADLALSGSATQLADDLDGLRAASRIVHRADAQLDFTAEVDHAAAAVAAAQKAGDSAALDRCHADLLSLRRKVILAHPGLAFDRLLVNLGRPPLYSHNVDQYLGRHSQPSPGLAIIEDWKSASPKVRYLTRDLLPPGAVGKADLSFDATKVLFSFTDHSETNQYFRRSFIYEAALDGSSCRQVTGTPADAMKREGDRYTVLIEDFDPAYLPDGGFVFTTTRCQTFGRCHNGRYTPSFYLYRGELDASNIHPLSHGEANEITPAVLNDGRLIYNRWDYINRHDCQFHKLWVFSPDGTNNANFWGNLTSSPLSVAEPHAIPGSNKVMVTATAHHSFTAGTILLVDPSKGDEGEAPLTHLTPEVRYPEAQGDVDSTYRSPYPIAEDLFFASYSPYPMVWEGQEPQRDDAYSAVLVWYADGKSWREPIFSDKASCVFAPIPIIPRQKPPVLVSRLNPKTTENTGLYYVKNVYESTQPIPPGSIKYLRVNEIIGQPSARVPHRGWVMDEITKKDLGTVPVEPNGSVTFRAPAGKPLQFQILDADKKAVMTMRTFVYLQPGEVTGCVGCHESRTGAPATALSTRTPPMRELQPPPGPALDRGFSYAAQVQPVWDRYCISCHGLEPKATSQANLLGTWIARDPRRYPGGPVAISRSYDFFLRHRQYYKMLDRNEEPGFSTPREAFAAASKLPDLLQRGHYDVKVDPESMERLITWLDLNGQFYGDYSFNRIENRKVSAQGVKQLRAEITRQFGAELAAQPFVSLVNSSCISESRILKAPLAPSAGGWGQIANGWSSTSDPGYQQMLKLVEASLEPLPYADRDGTCGRPDHCVCGSCWVRAAEERYRQKTLQAANKLAADASVHH